ncbi:hypothetical protein [Formicincola oecophyllae]|nr:hypothetical protein [Formicincola oecophyllae]
MIAAAFDWMAGEGFAQGPLGQAGWADAAQFRNRHILNLVG